MTDQDDREKEIKFGLKEAFIYSLFMPALLIIVALIITHWGSCK
jgi:hypothetical protein